MASDPKPAHPDESSGEPAAPVDAGPAANAEVAASEARPGPPQNPRPLSTADPLPNMRGVGAFLAGLEQKILGRQPVQDVVEDHSLHNRRTVGGVTLEFDPDPPQRPEPEDHSGAKL